LNVLGNVKGKDYSKCDSITFKLLHGTHFPIILQNYAIVMDDPSQHQILQIALHPFNLNYL